jgi:hypothetical protein
MQRSINGLKAGTTYLIQARSTSVQGTSEWSPIVEAYIPIPVVTPNAPTNVTATGNPDNIKISWTQATLNTDNTILSQPAYYEVYQSLSPTVNTSGTTIGKTSGSSFTYETTFYDVNQYFNVVTVDGFGNKNSTTANVVSAIATVPSVMSGLICKLSSYTRSSATANTSFTTTTPHGLSVGDKVYIHDAVSDQNTITNISVTGTTAIATTNAAHNFAIGDTVLIAGSSNDSFNETVIVTAVTTSIPYTFTYLSKASGVYSGYSYAYAKTGLSTANTTFGNAAEVLSIPTDKSFTCAPNVGTCAVNNYSTSYTVSSVTFNGTYVTYNVDSYPSGIIGFKLNVSGCVPNIFNTDDADITYSASNLIKIKSSATGSYNANSGTAVARPPGYMYPTDNAVRIKSDGITIGNMSTGYIVGISPTSFNMQSSGSNTRLSLTSSEIAMYKSGDKTVSLDGSNGNATIVGKFSTGFSPNARVELDSSSTKPESIKFYSGIASEIDPGFIETDEYTYQVASGDWNGRYYISSNLTMAAPDFVSEHISGNPQRPVMYINGGSVSQPVTTVSSSSNGVTLPTSTLYVESTSGFPKKPVSYIGSWTGNIYVQSSAGLQTITYTGVSGNSFNNCTGGTGLISTGNSVTADALTYPSEQIYIDAGNNGQIQLVSGATGIQQSIFMYPTYIQIASGSGTGRTNSINITGDGMSSIAMSPIVYSSASTVTVAIGQTTLSRLPDTGSVIGATFAAPTSGKVFITVSGTIQTNSSTSKLGWFLKEGAAIGSGATLTTGDEAAGAAIVHADVGAGNTYLMASSPLYLKTGLNAGSVYNVTFGHVNTDSATKSFSYRKITILPTM